jgi:hypothetical protein
LHTVIHAEVQGERVYDQVSRSLLGERGGYEAYVVRICLKQLQEANGSAAPLTIEVSDAGPQTVKQTYFDTVGAKSAADVIHELMPLLFSAGFKVLDMVLEWCLIENGISPDSKFFTFVEKIRKCRGGQIAVWPDVVGHDSHVRNVLLESYTAVRQKCNAIIHSGWGKNVAGKLEFDYSYRDDLSTVKPYPTVHDTDIVPESVTLAFAEFAGFVFNRLVDQSHQSSDDLAIMRRLSNQFQQLHLQPVVPTPPELTYRIIRTTEHDIIDIDDIVPTIKRIQPHKGRVSFELEIQRGRDRWIVPSRETALLTGKLALADLSEYKV